MDGYCLQGELDKANEILDLMAAERLICLPAKGLCPDVKTYTAMIEGFCREVIEEAKDLLENMEQSGCLPNSVTYNVIIWGCLKYGSKPDAMTYLKEMAKRGFTLIASIVSMLLDQIQGDSQDRDMINLIAMLV
ncbi:hypothetical protein LIER_43235 [Lithospermum erythrorhizon]|uniref:Pentatricopeptide repeat-containing protein n=1 Tax=Lithospermum erythrorhizon TaxID=34254 RepID=A0AAV3PS45_LITER